MSGTVDLEQEGFAKTAPTEYHLEKELIGVTGVLLMWSALVSAEGAVRVALWANPSAGLTADGVFPQIAQLLAGIVETVFGALGLLVAVLVLLFKMRNAMVVSIFSLVQAVLAIYVFVVVVVAQPVDATRRLAAGGFGLSLGMHRFMLVLSVLVVISWAAAMLGGQFLMASRMSSLMSGKPERHATHRLRTIIFTILPFVGGLATFLLGAIVLSKVDGSSPHLGVSFQTLFIIYPELYVTFGLVAMAWSILGLGGALTNSNKLLNVFGLAWWPVLLLLVVNFSLVLGKVPDGGLGAMGALSAYHTINVLASTLLPVVFARKIIESKEEPGVAE